MIQHKTIPREPDKISPFQIVILGLSIYVLISLFCQLIFKLPQPTSELLDIIDFGICIIFLSDFVYRFITAQNKLAFMKWGWIDLISSIPTIPVLRIGRAFRIIRIIRLLRAFRSTKILMSHFLAKRAENTFVAATLISLFLVIFGSIAILTVEDSPASNIQSGLDALWWAFSAVSCSGSGDKFPVTSFGKVLSILLALVGIGLFGTFTAFVARTFLEPAQKQEENELSELKMQVSELSSKLDSLIASSCKNQSNSKPGE